MDASASPPDDYRANELYWGSDLSVNQIADALDLSKGALYEMIRPLPAALACPQCRYEAVHPNRTAHERGLIVCLSCGWEGDEQHAAPIGPLPGAVPAKSTNSRLSDDGVRPGLTVPLVIGAAVGVVVLLWALRRK